MKTEKSESTKKRWVTPSCSDITIGYAIGPGGDGSLEAS